MSNIRETKYNIDAIREFFVSGFKPLYVSDSTKKDLENNEIPALINKDKISVEVPVEKPIEISPETPLVKANPNNVFVKAGSAINGFDVTAQTPSYATPTFIQPEFQPKEEVINSPVMEENILPKVELVTPQAFAESIEKPVMGKQVVQPVMPEKNTTDNYILINAKIENLRKEFNEKIEALALELSKIKDNTNLNLDEISRSVEQARQVSQNDLKAIDETLQDNLTTFIGLGR